MYMYEASGILKICNAKQAKQIFHYKIVQKQYGHLVQQNMQDRIPEAAYMYN